MLGFEGIDGSQGPVIVGFLFQVRPSPVVHRTRLVFASSLLAAVVWGMLLQCHILRRNGL